MLGELRVYVQVLDQKRHFLVRVGGKVAHFEIKECGRGSPAPPHSLFYHIIKQMDDDEDGWMDGRIDGSYMTSQIRNSEGVHGRIP